MVLTATRGALGFLSRLPVGGGDDAWDAFRRSPTAFPLAGYVLGGLLALPLLVPAHEATVAVLFLATVYLLTGVTHVDGLADVGDAIAVHGTRADRRAVMQDSTVGTGGALAVAFVVVGLGAAGFAIAGLPVRAVGLVVVAEVGAKLAMALQVSLGSASHEGLGTPFTRNTGLRALFPAVVVALPAVALTWPRPAPAIVALLVAVLTSVLVLRWTRSTLGGVSGDVLGATNELARLAALHAGVLAWMHW